MAISARWNAIAMCAPFVGFVSGIVVAIATQHERNNGNPATARGILTWCAFLAVGVLSRANASNLLHVGGSGQNFPEKLGV